METTIPRRLEDLLAHELEAGETLEWKSMPVPHFFSGGSLGAFLFSIPWTIFCLLFLFAPFLTEVDGGIIMTLFAIPFVLIGFGLMSSPLWTYRKCKKTIYAVTERRVILIEGGFSRTFRSFTPEQLRTVYRKEYRNGTGDIIIAQRRWKDSEGDHQKEDVGMLRIRNPKMVEEKIKRLAEQVRRHDSNQRSVP